jgi:hypothetical protein
LVTYALSRRRRKRHIATDTLGLLLVLIVAAADVQDSAGGKQVLDVLAAQLPSVTKGLNRPERTSPPWITFTSMDLTRRS